MKTTITTGLLLLSSLLATAQTPPKEFKDTDTVKPLKEYKVPNSRYTIKFPGDPTVLPAETRTNDRGETYTKRTFWAQDLDGEFILDVTSFPSNRGTDILKTFPSVYAEACGGTSEIHGNVNGLTFKHDGFEGIFFTVNCPAKGDTPQTRAAMIFVVAGKDIALIGVAWQTKETMGINPRAIRFFDSLKIDNIYVTDFSGSMGINRDWTGGKN